MDYNGAAMNNSISKQKRSPLREKQFRYSGQSLDTAINDLRFQVWIFSGTIFLFVIMVANEWVEWFFQLPPRPLIPSIIAIAVIAYCSIKIRRLRKQLHNYYLGQSGEREVAHILDQLTQKGYIVFHDVLAPHFNIDHVVISPNGIFAIETKTYSKPDKGTVSYDGQKITLTGYPPTSQPIDEANNHAAWLRSNVLKNRVSSKKFFDVKPVVVFVGWWYNKDGPTDGTWVLNPGMIEAQIANEPISLTQADIDRVVTRLEPYYTTSQ